MAGNRDAYEKYMSAGHDAAWDQNWQAAIRAYGQAVQPLQLGPRGCIPKP